MERFKRVVVVDSLRSMMTDATKEDIGKLSEQAVTFPDSDPESDEETAQRIGDADCALLSIYTGLPKAVLDRCPNLRYVGIAGTSKLSVDTEEAERRGITVANVTAYGDEPTSEFVFLQLMLLLRGLGGHVWKGRISELNGKTIGIIGLGAVGREVARRALGFGMEVLYCQRRRNEEWEAKGLAYAQLDDLLRSSDVISVNVPRDTMVLRGRELSLIPDESILVNTSVGRTIEPGALEDWLEKGRNFAIFDAAAMGSYRGIGSHERLIACAQVAGDTSETVGRLNSKFVANIRACLGGQA